MCESTWELVLTGCKSDCLQTCWPDCLLCGLPWVICGSRNDWVVGTAGLLSLTSACHLQHESANKAAVVGPLRRSRKTDGGASQWKRSFRYKLFLVYSHHSPALSNCFHSSCPYWLVLLHVTLFSPTASSLFCQQSLNKIKQRGGASFLEMGTFLHNGLVTGSEVHKANLGKSFGRNRLSFCLLLHRHPPPVVLFPLSVFKSLLVCTYTSVRHDIKRHFVCPSEFFRRDYDLHEKWQRLGPLSVFFPFCPTIHLFQILLTSSLSCALCKRCAGQSVSEDGAGVGDKYVQEE